MRKTTLLCPLATGFEETEAVTTIDILRRANIEVLIAGLGGRKIAGNHELTIDCDFIFEDLHLCVSEIDGIVLPGGIPGVYNLAKNTRLIEMLNQCNDEKKLIAAICAAPAHVLMKTDIIEGKYVTGHPSTEDRFWGATYMDAPTVVNEHIITSKGVGSAIDFALTIVSHLRDEAVAKEIAEAIVYPYFSNATSAT